MTRMIVLAAALALAACATTPPAPRTAEAECRIFEGPPHAIRAATRSGRLWIARTIEIGIEVCGWEVPGPEPEEVLVQIGSGQWLDDVR